MTRYPEHSGLREIGLASEDVFLGRLLHVKRDTVLLPDGSEATREYIVHPGAVMIMPRLPDGKLLFERQFRYPHQRVFIEFPAGKIDAADAEHADLDELVAAIARLRADELVAEKAADIDMNGFRLAVRGDVHGRPERIHCDGQLDRSVGPDRRTHARADTRRARDEGRLKRKRIRHVRCDRGCRSRVVHDNCKGQVLTRRER